MSRIEANTRAVSTAFQPDVPDVVPMRLSRTKHINLKRSAVVFVVNGSTASTLTGAAHFNLGLFDPTGEVKNTYQEYRIIQINCDFIPTQLTVNEVAATNYGTTHTAIDYHNDNVPSNITELEQYASHQVVQSLQRFQRTFTPRLLTRVFAGVTDAYATTSCYTWLSTDYDDANYYGIKWATGQNVNLGNIPLYTVNCTAVIQCRSPM